MATATLLLSSCATQQGYQGAGVGAVTGATAGILLDSGNRWRGGAIGGGLGALLGGALTDTPRQATPYAQRYYEEPDGQPYGYYSSDRYYSQREYASHSSSYGQSQTPGYGSPDRAERSAVVGGLTGATAGALLDNGNAWRGGLIGGALGTFFGWGIGTINSSPSIPVLRP